MKLRIYFIVFILEVEKCAYRHTTCVVNVNKLYHCKAVVVLTLQRTRCNSPIIWCTSQRSWVGEIFIDERTVDQNNCYGNLVLKRRFHCIKELLLSPYGRLGLSIVASDGKSGSSEPSLPTSFTLYTGGSVCLTCG